MQLLSSAIYQKDRNPFPVGCYRDSLWNLIYYLAEPFSAQACAMAGTGGIAGAPWGYWQLIRSPTEM